MRLIGYPFISALFAVQWVQPGVSWSLYAWFASVPLAILLDIALRKRFDVPSMIAWVVRIVTTLPPAVTFVLYAASAIKGDAR